MLISIIILAVAIAIPFFTFEKRKPKARHVVMIAVMSALTVVANIICAYTIPIHAGTALVIITGIAFGPQTFLQVYCQDLYVISLWGRAYGLRGK